MNLSGFFQTVISVLSDEGQRLSSPEISADFEVDTVFRGDVVRTPFGDAVMSRQPCVVVKISEVDLLTANDQEKQEVILGRIRRALTTLLDGIKKAIPDGGLVVSRCQNAPENHYGVIDFEYIYVRPFSVRVVLSHQDIPCPDFLLSLDTIFGVVEGIVA